MIIILLKKKYCPVFSYQSTLLVHNEFHNEFQMGLKL